MATINDQDGRRPELTEPPNNSPIQTVGVSGTAIYSGVVQPREEDGRLSGRERYKAFSETLANVSIVATGVRFFLNLVAKAEWKVEPADDSPRAQEIAEQVNDIINDMETPWHRVVRRAAMYRFYGFGVQEWTAKVRDDGVIGFLDVEPRPQITIERWDTAPSGKVLGCIQRSPQTSTEIYLPREKIVYLCDDSLSDSPEGVGLFRHIVKAARRLERYEQLEGFGYENDLRGVPILRAPLTALAQLVKDGKITTAQRDSLLAPLKEFVSNHVKNPSLGMLLDSQPWRTTDERQSPSNTYQYTAELLDGGEYSLDEMANAIRRVNLEIARVLGVEHLLLGDGDRGSQALSRDKSSNFGLIVDSTLKELTEAFEADLLRPLWKLNGWPEDLMPTLITETTASRDLEGISSMIRDLASAGVVLDRDDEAVAEMFRLMGLPRLVGQLETDPDFQLAGRGQLQDQDTPTRDDEGDEE